jgi:DNA-binding NarL/FixJ family response regulator
LKRVLMLGRNSLFRESIESLICREMEVEIIGRETSFERVLGQLEALQPDVIIVDGSDPGCDPGDVVKFIYKLGLESKVIGINLHDNQLRIYRGEQKIAEEVADLVEAIQI